MRFVIVGGGIAGVSCASELSRIIDSDGTSEENQVTILSASNSLKGIVDIVRITDNLEDFQVVERDLYWLSSEFPNIQLNVLNCIVQDIDFDRKLVICSGISINYDKLCICTGAYPKVVHSHPKVIGIRDLQSVEQLRRYLTEARRVVVVGNGGIAMELIHELDFCSVVWVLKDEYIGNAFLDASSSSFLMPTLHPKEIHVSDSNTITPRICCTREEIEKNVVGHGIGPLWMKSLKSLKRQFEADSTHGENKQQDAIRDLVLECCVEIADISWNPTDTQTQDVYPIVVTLTNGHTYECDFVVSATGVLPNVDWLSSDFERASDGGLLVDKEMKTNIPFIYAAGDACTIQWSESPHWFQMRLWTQAKTMGEYVAHCMYGGTDELSLGFNFEIFAHVTRFFGYKVVLLGLFNGQGLGEEVETVIRSQVVTEKGIVNTNGKWVRWDDSQQSQNIQILVRVTPRTEYIKLVIVKGRLMGALLIGDTDLEETFENLILNGLDVSIYGEGLLDDSIDIEDYFD